KLTDTGDDEGWCRLTVKVADLLIPDTVDTEMSLISIAGGPSSLTIVPMPSQIPSSEQSAPTTSEKNTKICSSGSIVALPQMVIPTLRVPFGVFGGMENGTLLKVTKST